MTVVIGRGIRPSLLTVPCSAYLYPYDSVIEYDSTCGFPLASSLNAGQSPLEATTVEAADGLLFAAGLNRWDVTCCCLS